MTSTSSARSVRNALLRAGGAEGRTFPVLVFPQFLNREVQYVAPSKESHLVTVRVDTGRRILCLDVPKAHPGQHILQLLGLLCPGEDYRLESSFASPLRNGDVAVARSRVNAVSFEVGSWTPSATVLAGTVWLRQHVTVYVTSPDHGLLGVRVPSGFVKAQLFDALQSWFGPERCAGVELFHIPAPGLGIDVYCLPLRGHSMLTVLLTDVSECDARPMLYSAAVPGPAVPTLSALRRDNAVLGAFWSAVLARQPSIMSHVILPASQVRTGMSLVFLHLGLDFCRAYDHGLRVDRQEVLRHLDLAELRPEAFRAAPPPGLKEQASQTIPLRWPPHARPVGGHSLLRHRYAKGCVPAPGQYPSGIPHTLHCPHFGVTCQLPCCAGLFLWALRMGEWVRAACTDSVEWSHVMAIGGLTTWDLPGVTVHGPTQVWKWPDEVQSLAGQCGHLFHEGRDPFVCDASKSVLHLIGGTLNGSVYVDRSTSSARQALKAGALALGAPRPFFLLGGLLLVDLVAGVRSVSDSPEDEEPPF